MAHTGHLSAAELRSLMRQTLGDEKATMRSREIGQQKIKENLGGATGGSPEPTAQPGGASCLTYPNRQVRCQRQNLLTRTPRAAEQTPEPAAAASEPPVSPPKPTAPPPTSSPQTSWGELMLTRGASPETVASVNAGMNSSDPGRREQAHEQRRALEKQHPAKPVHLGVPKGVEAAPKPTPQPVVPETAHIKSALADLTAKLKANPDADPYAARDLKRYHDTLADLRDGNVHPERAASLAKRLEADIADTASRAGEGFQGAAPTGKTRTPPAPMNREPATQQTRDSLRPRLEKTLTEAKAAFKAAGKRAEFEPHLTRAKQMLADLTKQGATNQQINREMAKFESSLEAGLAGLPKAAVQPVAPPVESPGTPQAPKSPPLEPPTPSVANTATHPIANNAAKVAQAIQKLSANPDHHGTYSVADIMDATGLSKDEVHAALNDREHGLRGKHGVLEGTPFEGREPNPRVRDAGWDEQGNRMGYVSVREGQEGRLADLAKGGTQPEAPKPEPKAEPVQAPQPQPATPATPSPAQPTAPPAGKPKPKPKANSAEVDDAVKAIGDLWSNPTSVNAYSFEDVQKLANSLDTMDKAGLSRVADAVKVRGANAMTAHALREMLKERIVETKGSAERAGMWRQPGAEQPAPATAPQPQPAAPESPPPAQPTAPASSTRSPMADKIEGFKKWATSLPLNEDEDEQLKSAKEEITRQLQNWGTPDLQRLAETVGRPRNVRRDPPGKAGFIARIAEAPAYAHAAQNSDFGHTMGGHIGSISRPTFDSMEPEPEREKPAPKPERTPREKREPQPKREPKPVKEIAPLRPHAEEAAKVIEGIRHRTTHDESGVKYPDTDISRLESREDVDRKLDDLELEKWDKDDLLALASHFGLSVRGSKTKPNLVEAIKRHATVPHEMAMGVNQ